ncbi:melatonin receptor type 1B-like, partial [Patella vulgata]|uniref:melatonin receptor type 1B-like n=1 Tax=Patella vulgata TaxID=6465 RepID=UPI00217F396A
LDTDPILAILYICVLCVALFIGTVGNTLTLVVSAVAKNVNKVGKEFIVNLALADICVSSFADPMCILGVVKGQAWFDDKIWFCELISSVCLTACFCAFLSLSLVSTNRYIYVCHNSIYYTLFKRKICMVLCVISWIIAFFFQFPNFIGWGDHGFDGKNHQCIWDRTANYSYTLFVSIALIGSPLFLMSISYVLIFYHIYETKVNVYSLNTDDPDRLKKTWTQTLQSSRTLFVLFLVFVFCWTPYTTVIAMDVKDSLPMEVHLFVTLLAHLHSSTSFLVYCIFNKSFRKAVANILCWGKSSTTSDTMDTKSTETSRTSGFVKKPVEFTDS